jgi:hypothetical protein
MWRRVDLVWTDVSEERIASIFKVNIRELETSVSTWLQAAALTTNLNTERTEIIVTIYMCDCRRVMDWWMNSLTTYKLGTKNNYNPIADLHSLQITRTH